MKIIIAGDGKVGSTLTRQLVAEGHDITLIDAKAEVLELSEERYDIMAVQGNCASMATLSRAGVEDAELLIVMTGADEVNLLCCTIAHGMNPNLHTIARIRNPEYKDQIYQMRHLFGLSMVVNPERQAAIEMERLIKYPGFLKRDTFAKGRVEIVELKIGEDSKLCNVGLFDLANVVKCKILVCAVLRDSKAVIPDGNFVLKAGDRIVWFGVVLPYSFHKRIDCIPQKYRNHHTPGEASAFVRRRAAQLLSCAASAPGRHYGGDHRAEL